MYKLSQPLLSPMYDIHRPRMFLSSVNFQSRWKKHFLPFSTSMYMCSKLKIIYRGQLTLSLDRSQREVPEGAFRPERI